MRGPAFFAYASNYLVDTANAIIVDLEACRAIRQAEVVTSRSMIDRTRNALASNPNGWRLIPRTVRLPTWPGWSRRRGFAAHPSTSSGERTAPFPGRTSASIRSATTTGRVLSDNTLHYLASTRDCSPCPLKRRCCPNTPSRKIPRDINEDAHDVARAVHGTPAFDQSRRDRKRVCCSPISSTFSSSAGCDCAGHAGHRMSSCSPPPHRTRENSPSSDQSYSRPSSQHEGKAPS